MVAAAIRRRGNEPLHTIEEILCLCIDMNVTATWLIHVPDGANQSKRQQKNTVTQDSNTRQPTKRHKKSFG
jgi:hypothetical protein